MKLKVAILVDGSFYLKRYVSLKRHKSGFDQYDAAQAAKDFREIMWRHLKSHYLEMPFSKS